MKGEREEEVKGEREEDKHRRIIGGKNRIVERAGTRDDGVQLLSRLFFQCAHERKKRRNQG